MWENQEEVYLILNGIVRSYYLNKEGHDITKYFMKENDFCIGEGFFSSKSMQGFEALENIKALKFSTSELKKIILDYSYLTQTYIEYLEQTLVYKMQRKYIHDFNILRIKVQPIILLDFLYYILYIYDIY